MYGLTDDEVAAIRDGAAESFSLPEAAVLRMADAVAGGLPFAFLVLARGGPLLAKQS